MSRPVPAFWLASVLAAIAPALAGATPPPPPPTATLTGPRPVCMAHFAILLGNGERADQYPDDYLVVTGPALSLGIRPNPASNAADAFRAFRANRLLQAVVVPGMGNAQRHPVTEWPGGRRRGWAYWLPQGSGPTPDYVTVAADQFVGTAVDYPVLRRVLTGHARRTICPASPQRN